MVSIKGIQVNYSDLLDNMTEYIAHYAVKECQQHNKILGKGIDDFCLGYPEVFQQEFRKRCGLKAQNSSDEISIAESLHLLDLFVEKIVTFKGECIFLYRDTFEAERKYRKKTGKGFGMLVNRPFFSKNEEEYFRQIDIVYKALQPADTLDEFLENYLNEFKNFLERNPLYQKKAQDVADYVYNHHPEGPVCFIDYGFQFTFVLFCWAALKTSNYEIEVDFYCLTTYPWLQDFFAEKIYSPVNESVLYLEKRGVAEYKLNLLERSKGSIVGFAIGDSMGFPSAGICREDVQEMFGEEIERFKDNLKHPYFSHLKAGEYTDNTNMLILSAQHIIEEGAFKPGIYANSLAVWGKGVLLNDMDERWLGPTAKRAIIELNRGGNFLHSGSTTTSSCSATYRVIPVGIAMRGFSHGSINQMQHVSEIMGGITHNSVISKAGCIFVTLLLSELLNGMELMRALDFTITVIQWEEDSWLLREKIMMISEHYKEWSPNQARQQIGTGSPIYQTLPLALYFVLKYQSSFELACIKAANSFRVDSEDEKQRIEGYSWKEQMEVADGGNTDGIAGLTCAFMGALLGVKKIPAKFLQIENKDLLFEVSTQLVC